MRGLGRGGRWFESNLPGRDEDNEMLTMLRNRTGLIGGRCATCAHFGICNGNLRVRAESATGDAWAEDPACYLTDDEISLSGTELIAPVA